MHAIPADFFPVRRRWKSAALAIAVSALLHGGIWSVWMRLKPQPAIQDTPVQVIEAALVDAKPAAPPQPPAETAKPPPKLEKPPEKPALKPAVKPKPKPKPLPRPVQQTRAEPETEIAPAPAPSTAAVVPPTEAPIKAAPVSAPVVEASYRAPGLNNPPTRYPRLALERGWEGAVVVRVHVLPSGGAGEIKLERSSGHDLLDEATIEQVRNWRFAPARRGDSAIDSWVVIPIDYKLKH